MNDNTNPCVRIVLLGASNLTRCLPTAVTLARAIAAEHHPDRSAHILVACGRGRSYGQASFLLGRTLPGILESGLWAALDEMPDGPTYALITDVGNDVIYGVEPATLLRWLEICFQRLDNQDCKPAVTSLPLDNVERVPVAFLEVFCKALFPSSQVAVPVLLGRAEQVDADLRLMCAERQIPIVEQPEEWFGVDPIHYSLRRRHQIWGKILAPWRDEPTRALPKTSKLIYWRAWYQKSGLFGKGLTRRQPCITLRDGTTISIY